MAPNHQIRAVTLELSQVSPRDFQVRETVDYFADRGFNTLVVFAVGYLYGEAYYPSKVAPEHEELDGRDLFGEILAAAHGRGLAVYGYINSFFGGPQVFDANPTWTARWADGRETTQVRAKGMCLNSPYAGLIASAAAEVCTRYEVDGIYLDEPSLQSWCACVNCVERYKTDTGRQLPLGTEGGMEELAPFLEWRSGVVADFVADVGRACKAARPGVTYFAQHAFPLSSTSHALHKHLFWGETSGRTPPQFADWYRPSFYGQDIMRVGRSLDMIGIEPWRRFAGFPLWWQGACVSYARAAGKGKPVLPLMEYPHFPWGLGRLSDDELAVNCADVIANGGDLWWPMYAPGAADRGGWEALSRIFPDVAPLRPAGAEQEAAVAILMSRTTAERHGVGRIDDAYLDDFVGTIQMIREMHLPYKVLMAENLEPGDLAGVSAVVVPSCACLGSASCGTLRDFVRDGGTLVAQGFTATHDDHGRAVPEPLLSDVLGVRLGPDAGHARLGYLVPRDPGASRVLVRDEYPMFTVTDAEVLYDVAPSRDLFVPPNLTDLSPAVSRHDFGAGQAFAVGPQLGRLRLRFEHFEGARIYGEMLGNAASVVRGERLGPQVGIHVWNTGEERQIIVVNATSVSETGTSSPLSGQAVRIAGARTARSLRGTDVAVRSEGDGIVATIRELGTWDCLVVA